MADIVTPEVRSRLMAGIRGRRNRSTELLLASLLRSARLNGWRRHLPITLEIRSAAGGRGQRSKVRPDFVFRKKKVAVFVDGCFWHGCPEHSVRPKSNEAFWAAKIGGNEARDRLVSKSLKARGWVVIRIWEHELLKPSQVLRLLRTKLERELHADVRRIDA